MVKQNEPDKEDIILDFRALEQISRPVTRDFYRKNSPYPERYWQKYWPTYKAFAKDASLVQETKEDKLNEFVKTNTPNPQLVETEKSEFTGNKWELSLPKTRIHTLPELLEYCKVDISIWQVERWVCNKWEMGYKDQAGVAQIEPLYQVKATLIRKQNVVDANLEIESLKNAASNLALIPTPVIRTSRISGNMLEIALNDAHFGKLSWSRETGGPDYDIRIAQKTFLEAVEHLLDRAKGYAIDQVLFVVGNDLLHSDNIEGQTTRGTVVDCDSRYQKTFEIVRETITKCIECFRQIAPVVVKMVSGNHDYLAVWHLGDSLSCLYRDYEDVTIDNEPISRKYYQWGLNGLLFVHGHEGKREDYPLLFATERPDIFGSTKWREVHTGHYHQTKTQEFHGVRVRIIPSLSPADNWHSVKGFIGQQRIGEAYLFNKTEGLIAQFYHNADN